MIPEPLWSMMLSTNDCYPGCACDDDRFRITRERILAWCRDNQDSAVLALEQLRKLIAEDDLNHIEIREQTNFAMYNAEDARDWLKEWWVAFPTAAVSRLDRPEAP